MHALWLLLIAGSGAQLSCKRTVQRAALGRTGLHVPVASSCRESAVCAARPPLGLRGSNPQPPHPSLQECALANVSNSGTCAVMPGASKGDSDATVCMGAAAVVHDGQHACRSALRGSSVLRMSCCACDVHRHRVFGSPCAPAGTAILQP